MKCRFKLHIILVFMQSTCRCNGTDISYLSETPKITFNSQTNSCLDNIFPSFSVRNLIKVVCFSRLLKCLRSLYGKLCGPRSDCSYRSSLFWVLAVCFYTLFVCNARQLFPADDFSRQHFPMHVSLAPYDITLTI